jgi:hypothetical protein
VGNFYKNVTLSGPGSADVAAALARYGRVAYLTPTRAGVSVVYDLESDEIGDPRDLGDLALTLSKDLSCPALAAAVYDDDDLLLGLYDRGTQVGEYYSAGASSLSSGALCRTLGVSGRAPIAAALLRAPHRLFVFESFRHALLLKALGLPEWAYASGYDYIQRGEPPPGLRPEDLLHVGEPRKWRARL